MDPFKDHTSNDDDRTVLVDAIALDEIPPAMMAPHVGLSCCICFDILPYDNVPRQGCSGTTETAPHYLCTDCEVAYLRAELSPGHAFDSQRFMGGDLDDESAIISQPGQLPCPQFISGNCDCAALSFAGLCGSLRTNADVAELYQTAFRRAVEAQTRQEGNATNKNETTNETESSEISETVLDVHRAVRTKLDEASMMKCPTCGYPGLKDHACMHITCEGPACSTRWCYACGRHRMRNNLLDDCRGCDAVALHLERQPALMPIIALPGEHPGIAARNEFHRRRMIYFLQRIKQETPKELWHEFKNNYPHLLRGVPTTGRMIRWEELDDPSPPPVFGNTTEQDLLWKLPHPRPSRILTVELAGSTANYYWKKLGRSVKYEARAVGRTIRRAKNETMKVLGIGIGTIRIHTNAMQYRLGDIVRGELLLQLTDPIPASRLVVQIRAFRMETKTVLDSNGCPHTQTTNKTLHRFEWQLDGKRTYVSGQSFHFSIQVPSQIEPQFQLSKELSGTRIGSVLSTANAIHQSVRSMVDSPIQWTLSAYLEIPWKVNLTAVVRISVDNRVSEQRRVN